MSSVDHTIGAPGRWSSRLAAGVSGLALSLALAGGLAPAMAQDADDEDAAQQADDVLVVTGIRSSLESAQDIKRDADVVVDAIVASDIGALPDRSVSEALQRVAGVSVLRFASPNDPDHFAVEGSGVIVRGLPYVRSELNGRDVFAANSGGRLGFEDVSPELLGSVAVFKNQSADMIEGGLAGTVDLRTRLPFDSNDRLIALSGEMTYSDFVEDVSPAGSGLFSDQWQTEAGTFGVLVSGSLSTLKSRADATQFADFIERTDIVADETLYMPRGAGIRTQEFDREREALAAAGQWESNDGRWLATAQFLQSDATLVWGENVLEPSVDDGQDSQSIQLLNDDYTVDGDGIFTSGIITESAGWRGNGNDLPLNGLRQLALSRERYENDVTRDYGLNLKFAPTEQLRFNADLQYVDASTEVFDVTVHGAFFGDIGFSSAGDSGAVEYLNPAGTASNYFQDRGNYYWRSMMDHAQDSDADSVAFRGDMEYDFSDDGWLKSVRTGVRTAKKDTQLRSSNYNWGNVSEIWTGSPLLTLDDSSVAALFPATDFSGFQRDGSPVNGVPIYGGPLAEDYAGFVDTVTPILAAQGSFATTLGQRAGVVDGTVFLPSEIGDVIEETAAFYVRGDFAFDNILGGLDGNVGLRYVATDMQTTGTFEVVSRETSNLPNDQAALDAECDPAQSSVPGFCSQDLAVLTTFFGAEATSETRDFSSSYDHWLPSLNLKLNLNESSLVRLGLSRSMVRPEAFDLRSSVTIDILPDVEGEYQGVGGTSGNPDLRPIVANQFDLSYEWYFSRSGSLSLAYFYKELEDYWIGFIGAPGENEGDQVTPGTFFTDATSYGVTLPATINTVANSTETASLQGFEISYQQFYDGLPGLLSGLGTQFNYTYVDADGVADIDNTSTARFPRDDDGFEQVSEHQFNLVGLYEQGPVQARLAYNWRDEFLLTKRDVIYPFASIYQEAGGQMDGSIFYDVSDSVKVGLQGVNLLDSITETTQTINEDGLRAPRSFNRNDRRYSLVVRARF